MVLPSGFINKTTSYTRFSNLLQFCGFTREIHIRQRANYKGRPRIPPNHPSHTPTRVLCDTEYNIIIHIGIWH